MAGNNENEYLDLIKKVERESPSCYLMDIDNEATVVVALNIAQAMDKAAKLAKVSYEMVYHKSLPVLF